MQKFSTLIGLSVKVFLDSHTVEGILESLDNEKIILNAEGSYILIYKNKINMVILNWNETVKEPSEPPLPPEYHQPEPEEEELEGFFVQNGIAENNQYGSIRPGILLEQQPIDPMERLIEAGLIISEEDFSINASTLYNEDGLLDRAERQRIREETKREVENGSSE